ncbi:Zn-ribbon domain-containing OB-fold protein [Nocardia miyunensis]|uniref:Zn-ribbon domain-containing OB-fold protein n=1 Tax=Nocardia miyunensis TaxID=282684 RepID=UPI00082CEA64|nr:OB-fold domain-containing protein [Nocardia miyunensis]
MTPPTHGADSSAPENVPLVDYLVLEPTPHLVANRCRNCGARFFDRRNACAKCFATEFDSADIATEGTVRTFSIVMVAAPGIDVPFVPAVVDCDGTSVRANLVNIEPTSDRIKPGLKVRLTTFPIGADTSGAVGVGFGFEPIGA